MTKLRKQRRRKVYRHNVNRKRLRNKIHSVGKISCVELKREWEDTKSVKRNMSEMGLSFDPNETIKIPNCKKLLKASIVSTSADWEEEKLEGVKPKLKSHVVEKMEQEANAPRAKLFRLPKSQVELITYLLDKYGKNYRAMSNDRRNHDQLTWKQIRQKVKRFKSIPEQFSVYLKSKGLSLEDYESDEDIEFSDGEL